MLQRKVYTYLDEWKNKRPKKALLITGARQIGKTYIIREYGKRNYKNFVEINFLLNEEARAIFDSAAGVDKIITNLTAFVGKRLEPGNTLVFFDEIQECPEARTAIKFLVEDGRYDYIESGSPLGINYKEVKSYPVGYEEIYQMYPMDFEEFVTANGVQAETLDYLRECYEKKEAVSGSVHNTMLQLFRYYVVVGGMPAVVQTFVDTHDIGAVTEIQNNILALYRQDIMKYSKDDKSKITEIFDRIPSELNEKNKRFILADISRTARMERYESCFNWLSDAGVSLPCYNVTEPKIPLKINEKHNLFKFFMADTGLLCAACLENVQFDILQNRLDVNMGSILENAFAELLVANGFEIRYFDKKNRGELDFVIQRGKTVIPIEIKSGNTYKSHSALNYVLDQEEWSIGQGIVFCQGNIEELDKVIYLPWYMIMFLKQERIAKGLIVEVDLSGLNNIGSKGEKLCN